MDRGMQMGEGGRVEPVASLPGAARRKIECGDLYFADNGQSSHAYPTLWVVLSSKTALEPGSHDLQGEEAKWYAAHGACGEALDIHRGLNASTHGWPDERAVIYTSELREMAYLGNLYNFAKSQWMARSAPEAASAEGSPSHPSGPSQDSQEVAAKVLLGILSRYGGGRSWDSPKWEDYAEDSQDILMGYVADIAAPLLSQSPKGAAGADLDRLLQYLAEEVDYEDNAHLNAAILAREAWGKFKGGEPSAPKTGLRGAPRLVWTPGFPKVSGWYLCRPPTAGSDQDVWQGVHVDVDRNGFVTYWDEKAEDWLPAPGGQEWAGPVAPSDPEAPQAPLSAAKGPDLPPSSQPAPGDVGEAGGAAT